MKLLLWALLAVLGILACLALFSSQVATILGDWTVTAEGRALLAIVTLGSLLAGIVQLVRRRASYTPNQERAELSYATTTTVLAQALHPRVSLVYTEITEGAAAIAHQVARMRGELPTEGRTIGGLFQHRCRVWNTGSRPLRDLTLVLSVAPSREGGLTGIARQQESILDTTHVVPLGGPRVEFRRQQDDQELEANLDLINPGQRAELRLTTVVEEDLPLTPDAVRVAARAEGLPPAVRCFWDDDENAPPVPRERPQKARGTVSSWLGRRLLSVARIVSSFSKALAQLGHRLRYRFTDEQR